MDINVPTFRAGLTRGRTYVLSVRAFVALDAFCWCRGRFELANSALGTSSVVENGSHHVGTTGTCTVVRPTF